MSVVVSILIALAVAVALVLGSRLWFDRVQKRAHAQRIGIEVLNTRRWREALDLLVQALVPEGYVQSAELTGPGGMPLAERHLTRGGSRVLLIYKHGTSYRIGAPALLDAERRRQDAEVDEVIVATLGSLDDDAIAQAARMKVTCLDGATVWAKAQSVLDVGTRNGVAAEAEALVDRPRRLATVGATVLGLAIVFWGGNLDELAMRQMASEDAPHAATPAVRTTPEDTAAPRPSAASGAVAAIVAPIAPSAESATGASEATAEVSAGSATESLMSDAAGQRGALAKAITALAEVERASWSSASTMIVSLRPRISIDTGVEKTCALSADHPLLREVRLQVEASGGSDVRWRRCG
ncbi:MAG: hypothetical protein ACRC2H_03370 [Silanimonas sp.]